MNNPNLNPDPRYFPKQKVSVTIGMDLVGFGITLAAIWKFAWKPNDLVWSFWTASITIGSLTMLKSILEMVSRPGPIPVTVGRQGMDASGTIIPAVTRELRGPLPRLAIGLFLCLFFAVHFGGFHIGHAFFLSFVAPTNPSLGLSIRDIFSQFPEGFFEMVGTLIVAYWPMVLASALTSDLFARRSEPDEGANFMLKPYANIARMHLLIFLFLWVSARKVDNLILYGIILFLYFFPWKLVWALRRSAEN